MLIFKIKKYPNSNNIKLKFLAKKSVNEQLDYLDNSPLFDPKLYVLKLFVYWCVVHLALFVVNQ